MTEALCIDCGVIKKGVRDICPTCQYDPGEDNDLALILSDAYLNPGDLRTIGHMIQEISRRSDDPEAKFLALLQYLIDEFSNVLEGGLPDDAAVKARTVLSRCTRP